MKRILSTTALAFGLALAGFTAIAEAQQRVQPAQQPGRVQGSYAPVTPAEFTTCRVFRIWMAQSGLVFHCNGIAMTFTGGNQPGGIAAATSLLLQYRADESNIFVRYQMDPDNAACAEIDYTRYENMFEAGQCARVISLGY
jgi:hypothetical protein